MTKKNCNDWTDQIAIMFTRNTENVDIDTEGTKRQDEWMILFKSFTIMYQPWFMSVMRKK